MASERFAARATVNTLVYQGRTLINESTMADKTDRTEFKQSRIHVPNASRVARRASFVFRTRNSSADAGLRDVLQCTPRWLIGEYPTAREG
jgi:hypothetical protein